QHAKERRLQLERRRHRRGGHVRCRSLPPHGRAVGPEADRPFRSGSRVSAASNPAEKRARAGPFLIRGSSLPVMFTGIVSERARVASFDDGRLVVETGITAEIGDSVAVDGVCLTVTESGAGHLAFDVLVETLRRAKPFGEEVNLEDALRAGEPLGGHYVQGHVDATGTVRSVEPEGGGKLVWFEAPAGV